MASLMFSSKAGANPSEVRYYEKSEITAVKSFIGLPPGPNVIKLFLSVIY
jgi:hypothetical protein